MTRDVPYTCTHAASMSATDDCAKREDARRTGPTDVPEDDRAAPNEAEVGLDTPGRIGAYRQRRTRPRDTSREWRRVRGVMDGRVERHEGEKARQGGGRREERARGKDLRNPLSSENPRREATPPVDAPISHVVPSRALFVFFHLKGGRLGKNGNQGFVSLL